MQTDIFARVILTPSGDLYIAFRTKRVVKCTASNLIIFLSDPVMFHDTILEDCRKEANIVNPDRLSLPDIPGLTLAYATDDGSVVCTYTILFRLLSTAMEHNKKDFLMRLDVSAEIPVPRDEKEFMLYLYSQSKGLLVGKAQFKRKLNVSASEREQFFDELVNCMSRKASGAKALKDSEASSGEPDQATADVGEAVLPPANYVSVKEYAALKNVSTVAVRGWLTSGKIKNYFRSPNGRWYVDPDSVVVDGRTTRKSRPSNTRRPKFAASRETYDDVQKRILEDGIVTDAVRPYIRKFKEALYYRDHYYHEVSWSGLPPSLIIDVNPEYICRPLGKSNLELMREGLAPVIPREDKEYTEETIGSIPRYHLHHIGQERNSPLAVIPSTDHNNKKFSAFFHPHPHEKNLHDAAFEATKATFWRTYAKTYIECGSFQKIPYLNHRDRTPKYIKRQGGEN